MSKNELSTFTLAKKFSNAVLKSRKKAGQQVGRAFVNHRRLSLGAVDPRRKKAVIYRVAKKGALIVYDMAPMAVQQEFGETVQAKGPRMQHYIRVSELQPGEMPVRRGDYLLAVARGGKEPRLLGVYKDKWTVKRAPSSKSFFDQIEDYAQPYEDALLKTFDEQDILL